VLCSCNHIHIQVHIAACHRRQILLEAAARDEVEATSTPCSYCDFDFDCGAKDSAKVAPSQSRLGLGLFSIVCSVWEAFVDPELFGPGICFAYMYATSFVKRVMRQVQHSLHHDYDDRMSYDDHQNCIWQRILSRCLVGPLSRLVTEPCLNGGLS